MFAAVKAVTCRDVRAEGFFAVKKDKLDPSRCLRTFAQNTREFDEEPGARTRVVGTDESDVIVEFGVVVGAEQSFDRLFPGRFAKAGEQIGKLDVSAWRFGGEGLAAGHPSKRREFLLEVFPGVLQRFRSRRTRPETDESGDMGECLLTRDLRVERIGLVEGVGRLAASGEEQA